MSQLAGSLDAVAARTRFSGALRVERDGEVVAEAAYGFAHRGYRIANTPATSFGLASGTKGLTALAVVSLVEEGVLALESTARPLLGEDLPLIGEGVTVEHLLSHRSGIGDYIDEETDLAPTDYVLPVGVHELETTEDYLRVLDGYTPKFEPGERFAYCNSGYVVLALIAERASGVPFHRLVHERVCEPAGMGDTAFLRSDEPDGRTALGYLEPGGSRTNVLHLPVVGSGDGGICSTVADVHALWRALYAGRIVSMDRVARMTQPHSEPDAEGTTYGLGFWLRPSRGAVLLVGADAGVSFRSVHHPGAGLTATVVSNTSEGAWPVARHLDEVLAVP